MLSHPPLVSIIIPTYNRAHLISETIRSVLNQTFDNWEILIIDDGSEDQTDELIDAFQDRRIKYLCIQHTGNFGRVRNEGLKLASGIYIAFLDSDDIWEPHKLEKQIALLEQHDGAYFIFNNVEFFGTESFSQPPGFAEFLHGNFLIPMLEENGLVFYPSTLLFHRKVIEKIGLLDESLVFANDLKYFLTLSHHFTGIFINDRLVKIRRHKLNTTRFVSADILLENISILGELYQANAIAEETFKSRIIHYYYKMALTQLRQKQHWRSAISFYSYIKQNPSHWKGWARLIQAIMYAIVPGPKVIWKVLQQSRSGFSNHPVK
jgi:glycosyltransferase involved in cell wall biosynthesis